MKLETCGTSSVRRIFDDKGVIIGFASQLTNGQWCACDYRGPRIAGAGVFDKPAQVLKWFKENQG